MPIDETLATKPATQGQLANIAIDAVVALRSCQLILFELAKGRPDLLPRLEEMGSHISDLSRTFDELTGYKE